MSMKWSIDTKMQAKNNLLREWTYYIEYNNVLQNDQTCLKDC